VSSREEGGDAHMGLEVGAAFFGIGPASGLGQSVLAQGVGDGERGCRIAHGRRPLERLPVTSHVRRTSSTRHDGMREIVA